MRQNILKRWKGFVPSYLPHPNKKCAYYHCTEDRTDGRYCDKHALEYTKEAEAQGGARVIDFRPNASDSDV